MGKEEGRKNERNNNGGSQKEGQWPKSGRFMGSESPDPAQIVQELLVQEGDLLTAVWSAFPGESVLDSNPHLECP